MIPGGGGGANVKSGAEGFVTEGTSRAVIFGTAFASTPWVIVSLEHRSGELATAAVDSVSPTGFTLYVNKIGGGGSIAWTVNWIATDAGDP